MNPGVGDLSIVSSITGGRYPISGSNYLALIDTTYSGVQVHFDMNFSRPAYALGFYGIDIGDYSEQLELVLTYVDSTTETVPIPHLLDTNEANASVIYFGLISTQDFVNARINDIHSSSGYPAFAFDDITIGATPEPAAFMMVAAGLLLVGLYRRGRHSSGKQ